MTMNRFFTFCMTLLLAGCGGTLTSNDADWFTEYGTLSTGTPAQMYGTYDTSDTSAHTMAVLLPLSGDNAPVGQSIRTSVELAVLQNAPETLSVSFYDTADDATIDTVLASAPEIVVGPVFANNANKLRQLKDAGLPVLAFTSDASVVGDGVMSMSLLPNNSIEIIVSEMASAASRGMIMLAPESTAGHMMSGAAENAARIYNVPVRGIFFYNAGDTDSIKNATIAASMNNARVAANNKAREILSDILTSQGLTALEKSSLNMQLDRISKSDTIGKLPYDTVLLLGSGDDAKTIASFLRYYGVGTRDAQIYGTAMWDGTDVASDFTLTGARYATMPDINTAFADEYSRMTGTAPSRLAAFGYDATNMAIGMIYSSKTDAAYLLDPSGYIGANGLFRLMPSGTNERALRVMELDGTGTPREIRPAQSNFMTPLYTMQSDKLYSARAMDLDTRGINPLDYINLPERLRGHYKSKTFGANMTNTPVPVQSAPVTIIESTEPAPAIVSPDFTPLSLDTVAREYIDSVEIVEE